MAESVVGELYEGFNQWNRSRVHAAEQSLAVGRGVTSAIRCHLALACPAAPSEGLEVKDEVRPTLVVQRVVAEGTLVRLEPSICLLRRHARQLLEDAQVTLEGTNGSLCLLGHALAIRLLPLLKEVGD